MTLHSTRPYVVRDGRSYCAACGRRRLARIEGTRFVCCPDCDAGVEIPTGSHAVVIVAGTLVCGECGASELVAAPRSGRLECPRCDTPPWEREQVAAPVVVQESLGLDLGDEPDGDVAELPGRPARPDPVVFTCFFCRQSCWHRYVWRQVKWVAVCTGCGSRLAAARVKVTRSKVRGRSRG